MLSIIKANYSFFSGVTFYFLIRMGAVYLIFFVQWFICDKEWNYIFLVLLYKNLTSLFTSVLWK